MFRFGTLRRAPDKPASLIYQLKEFSIQVLVVIVVIVPMRLSLTDTVYSKVQVRGLIVNRARCVYQLDQKEVN